MPNRATTAMTTIRSWLVWLPVLMVASLLYWRLARSPAATVTRGRRATCAPAPRPTSAQAQLCAEGRGAVPCATVSSIAGSSSEFWPAARGVGRIQGRCRRRDDAPEELLMSDRQRDQKDDDKRAPRRVPLLPLRDIVVFPHMVVPLFVGREKSISALEEAMGKGGYKEI